MHAKTHAECVLTQCTARHLLHVLRVVVQLVVNDTIIQGKVKYNTLFSTP